MSSNNNSILASPQERQKKPNISEDILKNISPAVQKVKSKFLASIYRVPMKLRNLNERAYTPSLVSIGPLHCKDENLKTPMQDIKLYYVNSFLGRMTMGSNSDESKLEKLINEMRSTIDDASNCYAAEVKSELDEEMLVIDGCFVLEVLYRYYERSNRVKRDPIFGCLLTFHTIQHDLLLLENQLPFSALNKLFCLAENSIPSSSTPKPCLTSYVCSYFHNMVSCLGPNSTKSDATNCGKCLRLQSEKQKGSHHILDIILKHVLLEEREEQRDELGIQCSINFRLCRKSSEQKNPRPSASELVHAGVKFEGCNRFEFKFYEVKGPLGCCRRARFRIPILTIDDSTELFFRNLIAFEHCFPDHECRFTSYASHMDKLINTAKDVEELEKAGVIVISLGCREEAVNLFNKLCKETLESLHPDFAEPYDCAARYAKRCWPAAMAYMRREYFATPWTTIAFAVAFIAFGITVTQFILSFV